MIKAMRDYMAFTKRSYKILTIVVLPLIYGIINGVGICAQIPAGVLGVLALYFVIPSEMFMDHWFLGGFYKKGNGSLEFLQSSNYFSTLIRNVVVMDMIRKVLTYVVLYVVLFAVFGDTSAGITEWLLGPIMIVALVYLGNLISRHYYTWYEALVVAMVVSLGGALALLVLVFSGIGNYMNIVLTGVTALAIGIAVVTFFYSLKKVRDSYYD